MSLRRSPLDDRHRSLGATLVEFGGWEMPISYPTGTIEEHLACRRSAAMFDVSHLGSVRVDGPDALASLQGTLTNDLTRIAPGRAQYTHLLDPDDASVLDDIIVWWLPDPSRDGDPEAPGATFDVMPNASNTDRVVEAVGGVDTTSTRALIAVQGPDARSVVASVFPEAGEVGRFRVERARWRGDVECIVAGTGYTGEPGVEIAVPNEAAPDLWDALAPHVTPAGLGARDTLRLEAGLPLHGLELGPGISPLEAGLAWVVAWGKPRFQGRDAVLARRDAGIGRRLVGVVTEGRRPARSGCAVRLAGGSDPIGVVTSGNFSPVLGHGIAMAFVPSQVEVGSQVVVDVRGRDLAGTIVTLPFV